MTSTGSERLAKWVNDNPGKHKAAVARWATNNPEKVKASKRQTDKRWRASHPAEARDRNRRGRLAYLNTVKGGLTKLFNTARDSVGKRGPRRRALAFSITLGDVLGLWESQGGQCPVTGIAMRITTDRTDFSKPSIDRIDSAVGYITGNVRLVCKWANYAKNSLSDQELIAWCRLVVVRQSAP